MEIESKESSKNPEKEKKKGRKPKGKNEDTAKVNGLEFSLDEIKSKSSETKTELEFSLPTTKKKQKTKQNSDEEGEGEAGDQVFKPGQKHREPPHDDPLRAFYESLYEQNPKSQMAQKYCLENGLLSEDVAKKVMKSVKSAKKSK